MKARQDLLSLIWGPITLLLQISSQLDAAFDCLLDTCKTIGDNAPRLERNSRVFAVSEDMQKIIAYIYEDILEFYLWSIKFFRRRTGDLMLSLGFKDIKVRAGDFIANLKRHQELVDKEAQAKDIERSQQQRDNERYEKLRCANERIAEERLVCLKWVRGSVDRLPWDMKQQALSKKTEDTGSWLLQSTELEGWMQSKHHLWLHGKPGAGKVHDYRDQLLQ